LVRFFDTFRGQTTVEIFRMGEDRFIELVTSEKFKAFGGTVKPFVTIPPQPQLYETDLSRILPFPLRWLTLSAS
jgi:hypothetical protein